MTFLNGALTIPTRIVQIASVIGGLGVILGSAWVILDSTVESYVRSVHAGTFQKIEQQNADATSERAAIKRAVDLLSEQREADTEEKRRIFEALAETNRRLDALLLRHRTRFPIIDDETISPN